MSPFQETRWGAKDPLAQIEAHRGKGALFGGGCFFRRQLIFSRPLSPRFFPFTISTCNLCAKREHLKMN